MKKLTLIMCGILYSILVTAQCSTAPCTNIITFPISTNDFNNSTGIYQGFGADRCIEGCGTFGFDLNIPSNAAFTSFNGTGTGIDIKQYWNMNSGGRGYLAGLNFVHHLNMGGGNDSAIIYCSVGSQTECNIPQLNNYNNYVFLADGATWLMDGTSYMSGMTYQGQGNSTNVLHFVSCGSSTPLAIEQFYLRNDVLHWDYQIDVGMSLKMSCDALNYSDVKTIGNEYIPTETGYYQLSNGEKHSKVIKVIVSHKEQTKRVELYEIKSINLKAWKTIK